MMEKKLKTLLAAVEHEVLRKPSKKTLDALSLLAGFQDWDEFQQTFRGEPTPTPPALGAEGVGSPSQSEAAEPSKELGVRS